MSYEPLHHKYRPQTFAELVGQEAIAQTLSNALNTARIAPAYLFTGPRGTGKTSSSRILAKSLNCLKCDRPTPTHCGECDTCRQITKGNAMDVIEIDAASNTGVDNIREIIERAQFAPVQCRYKVYVIDECHMLSVPAFNALLKTLEEPPPRVVFVLATTDPQRVLTTIISRCQRFDFRRIPLESMVNHLTQIAHNEGIEIAPDAITLVAQIANGGLRDAESLLDQLSLLSGEITVEKVWDLVGAVPEQDLLKLLKVIRANSSEQVITQCRHLMNRGREPLIVLQNLANFYLNLLIAKTSPQRNDLVAVTAPTWQALCEEAKHWQLETILQGQQKLKESEFQLKNTTQPRLWLEVTLLGLLPSALLPTQPILSPPAVPPQNPAPTPAPPPVTPQSQNPTPVTPPPASTPAQNPAPVNPPPEPSPTPVYSSPTPQDPETLLQQRIQQSWQKVLDYLLPFTRSFVEQKCTLLDFDLDDCIAYIGVPSQGLLKIAQAQLKAMEEAFEKVFHQKVKVNLQVGTKATSSAASPAPVVSHSAPKTPSVPPPSSPSTPPETHLNHESSNGKSASPNPLISELKTPAAEPPKSHPTDELSNGKSTSLKPLISELKTPAAEPPQPQIIEPEITPVPEVFPLEGGEEDDQEIEQAVKQVMKMFSGHLIDFGSSISLPIVTKTPEEQSEYIPEAEDDKEDADEMPF